jgi:hypothetical protein
LIRNYICCKHICAGFWWLHVRNTCINWGVGLHSSSCCPCMIHYPWQYKDFSLKLHIQDFVEISRNKRFTPWHAYIIFFTFSILFNLLVLLFWSKLCSFQLHATYIFFSLNV